MFTAASMSPDHRDEAGAAKPVRDEVMMLGALGDYDLLEEIGRGGQGVVYRARQKGLNRTVALKVIRSGQWTTKEHLKRFRLEAEAAASLDNSNIVPIYEVGEHDGCCYFSMKFVEGGPLDEVFKREPIPIRRATKLIAKLARAVHYAHQHGILHRDIKPGNMLLKADGNLLLSDFGLVKVLVGDNELKSLVESASQSISGTPAYMAPEQFENRSSKRVISMPLAVLLMNF